MVFPCEGELLARRFHSGRSTRVLPPRSTTLRLRPPGLLPPTPLMLISRYIARVINKSSGVFAIRHFNVAFQYSPFSS